MDKLVVLIGVALIVLSPLDAQEPDRSHQLFHTFSQSRSSVEKSRILFSLRSSSDQTKGSAKKILLQAIKDESPTVVSHAVDCIGYLGLSECSAHLIKLYDGAQHRFASYAYAERVQCAIVKAMANLDSNENRAFINELLTDDRGSFKGQLVLQTIDKLNDPSFVKTLSAYQVKIESKIKKAKDSGVDPFLYSDQEALVTYCGVLINRLAKKGVDNE